MSLPFTKKTRVRIFWALLALGLGIGGSIAYYLITEKFDDTKNVKAQEIISSLLILKSFEDNDSIANERYRDKIVEVNGRISEINILPVTTSNDNNEKKIEIGDSVVLVGGIEGKIVGFSGKESFELKGLSGSTITVNRSGIQKIIKKNRKSESDFYVTIKMADASAQSYLIFDFQDQDVISAQKLLIGDSISVRASCSGSVFSRILNTRSVQFKRATLIQKF